MMSLHYTLRIVAHFVTFFRDLMLKSAKLSWITWDLFGILRAGEENDP